MRTGIRFVGVGIAGTAGYFAISSALMLLLGIDVKIANVLAYAASMGVSYFGHRHVTFRSRGRILHEGWKFAVTHGINLILSTLLLMGLVDGLGVNRYASVALSTLFIMASSFVIMRAWVFRDRGA